jgi:hypothetical protein
MDQVALSGSLSWQPSGAPLNVVNFLDNVYYTSVFTYEVTPDSGLSSIPLDGGTGDQVTAVYMEVYDQAIVVASSPKPGGGTPSQNGQLVVAGQLSGSGGSPPVTPLVGRFLYTCPIDVDGDYPSQAVQGMYAFPINNPTAQIWVFVAAS